MTMVAPSHPEPPLITADELLRMPRGRCREYLLRGRLVQQSYRGARSGHVAVQIMVHLGNHVSANELGHVFAPCGFQLAWEPDTVLAPAVAFVRGNPSDELSEGYHQGPPDLAIELVCPSERPHHLDVKVSEWLAAGCPMLVVVNPRRRSAIMYRPAARLELLTENDVIDGGDVVPGWTLPLRDLFG
ncbi:MAG: Uma2 family endonuclease [Longimicrobiaceae bacterium]